MIQIDMRLPEKCEQCPLCHRAFDGNETRLACFGLGAYCYEDDGRLDNCPLHEVIADPDTVSRQAVLDAVDAITKWSLLDRNGCHVGVGMKYRDVKETVKSLPPSPSRPSWIPCSERLPEERQEILATTTDNAWGDVVIIRTYYKEMHKSVIAWMPLPKPYRAERRTDSNGRD